MGKNKISKEEIDLTINRIRGIYEILINQHYKPISLLGSFNERYFHTLKQKFPLENFLAEEIKFAQDLLQKEKDKITYMETHPQVKKSGVDSIIEGFQERMELYPKLDNKLIAEDVSRLYGAIKLFYEKCWKELSFYLLGTEQSVRLLSLEKEIPYLISREEGKLPPQLDYYHSILSSVKHSSTQRIREAQKCIQAAAFWLNSTNELIKISRNQDPNYPYHIDIIAEEIEQIIADFRLVNLTRN